MATKKEKYMQLEGKVAKKVALDRNQIVKQHQKDLARIAGTAAGRKAIAEFRAKTPKARVDALALAETKAAKKATKKTMKSFR